MVTVEDGGSILQGQEALEVAGEEGEGDLRSVFGINLKPTCAAVAPSVIIFHGPLEVGYILNIHKSLLFMSTDIAA